MDGADQAAVAAHLVWLGLRGDASGSVDARRRALVRLAAALPAGLLGASPVELYSWRAGLLLAPVTVRSYVSHAHQFYAWALHEGLVAVNPAVGLPVPPRPGYLPRPIRERDLLAALVCAPPRVRPWLVLAAWVGLRAKEIALLRRENVLDMAPRPVVRVARDATKGSLEHLVPMSAFVLAEIVPVLPASGWVFRRFDGRPGPNSPSTVSKLCNEHLHACDVTATLHQLRHRFATEAYRAGHDLRAVQGMLGHKRPDSTAAYADYDQLSAAAAVEAIPAPRRRERRRAG